MTVVEGLPRLSSNHTSSAAHFSSSTVVLTGLLAVPAFAFVLTINLAFTPTGDLTLATDTFLAARRLLDFGNLVVVDAGVTICVEIFGMGRAAIDLVGAMMRARAPAIDGAGLEEPKAACKKGKFALVILT